MTHRFALFVDGSNLFGSLKNMNVEVSDYEPFYRFIFDEGVRIWRESFNTVTPIPSQLRRVYWYVVGSIDQWDLSNPKAQLYLHERFKADFVVRRTYLALAGPKFPSASQEKIEEEAWAMCFKEFQDWYEKKKEILDGMRTFHYSVRTNSDFIDINECGHWKVDFLHRSLTEKGLDTAIAVDMLAMQENYDVALVLSGDADSIPSINYMKRRNKHVGAVEFLKGYPPEKRGRSFSSSLKLAADFVVQIYEMDLVSKGIGLKPLAGA